MDVDGEDEGDGAVVAALAILVCSAGLIFLAGLGVGWLLWGT